MTSKSEIAFARAGGRDLKLDLYRPDRAARAIILMVHGGGWRRGSRDGIATYGGVFARLGFVAVAAEYRLLDEAPWPAQLDDVRAALAWVASNRAQLNASAAPLAILGFSAGGHLALLAADEMRNETAAVIALFPPVELVTDIPDPGQTAAAKLLGEGARDAEARLASPLRRAGPHFPPTFLLHGTDDWGIPHVTSQRMFEALLAAGVKVELHLYAGMSHEFADAPYMMGAMAAEVANFLHRTAVDPAGARQEDLANNPFARGPKA